MIRATILIILCAVFCASCGKKATYTNRSFDGFTQGTTYHIVIRDSLDRDITPALDSMFAVIENSMSVFNENSLISRINRNETDSLDRYIKSCIEIAARISEQSGGLYDITIKPLTGAYGFAGGVPEPKADVDSLRALVGYRKISVADGRLIKENPAMQIDLNSIAQGYTVDMVADYIENKLGIKNYIVEMGGEIFARGGNGTREWIVGVDRPLEGNITPGEDLQGTLKLSGRGLATSGNYRKSHTDADGRKVVHTINPLTGEPVISNLLSATVVAADATLADAYGTMFMVMGLDASKAFLAEHPEIDAMLVYSDEQNNLKTYTTKGLEIIE